MKMTFDNTEDGVRMLAVYVSQLVKEGVTFKIVQHHGETVVELLGGF